MRMQILFSKRSIPTIRPSTGAVMIFLEAMDSLLGCLYKKSKTNRKQTQSCGQKIPLQKDKKEPKNRRNGKWFNRFFVYDMKHKCC